MLLLFDIDGTLLLGATREHAESMLEAMRRVYRVSRFERDGIELAGRTDLSIARTFLTIAGVDDARITDGFEELRSVTVEEFAARCPRDLSSKLSPGIDRVLETLALDHELGLVTGNFEPIARLKLNRAGIGRYFEPGHGGFGSDHEDRAVLPPLARKRAGGYPREQTVVIGDTPRDIACAHADGVHAIAVTTGHYGADQLRDADAVVSRAGQLPAAIASLG